MSNLQHITSKIKKDSEVQRDAILAEANINAELIISKRESAAKKDAADLIEKSKKEAITKKARVLSSATLKVRNEKLAVKQNIISSIFDKSEAKLNAMTNEEFKEFITNKVLNLNISGIENIIVNNNSKKILDETFIAELNLKLKDLGKTVEVKLSDIDGNFEGGFILENNGIEINYTFESLVNSLRDEMEFEVANTMFN
ncbi:V-type ATP synthase subunit E [uncultured Clostridium sp.]|uniref:V-type ATP synthase subunit E n=1 Tax=uncultured Clostridium sp. TaxID=59620 RepID=UPI00262F1099|nr:V-type ATP synthase subunit E family protein [uncultured Clostridium sp.]